MDNLLIKCRDSLESINKYSDAAKEQVKKIVMEDGVVSKSLMAREQHAAHSLAWIATYKATLTELLNWAERLESENKFLETEQLILQFAQSFSTSEMPISFKTFAISVKGLFLVIKLFLQLQ